MFKNMEEKLYNAAKDFVKRYENEDVSEHIINIIVSVMKTRDGIGPIGGSFVQSVVNNDLCGAVVRADNECLKHIKLIALSRNNCFCED
jgi:hypothetical protein